MIPTHRPLPHNACDCHVHVFGPAQHYPFDPARVYTPGEASVAELDALHLRLGISRVVLVQPSVYGIDNSRVLDALADLGPRARAVAVINARTSEADLDRFHAAGVRGVRVNIATHGMNDPDEAWRLLLANAARAERLGWHVQVLTSPGVIDALAHRLPDLPVPLVIDHFGLVTPGTGLDQPGFRTLLGLLATGRMFLKLSAIERLTGAEAGAALMPFIKTLVAAAPESLVWGSDWPHTGGGRTFGQTAQDIEPFQPLDDARAIDVMIASIADPAVLHQIFVSTPARLYDFA